MKNVVRDIVQEIDKTALVIAMEELSEMIHELSIIENQSYNNDNFSEEFADVIISIQLVQEYTGIPKCCLEDVLNISISELLHIYDKPTLSIIDDISIIQKCISKIYRNRELDKYMLCNRLYDLIYNLYSIGLTSLGIPKENLLLWYERKLTRCKTRLDNNEFR